MELSALKGIGPATLKKLRAMGINSLRELLYYQPFRYEDQTKVTLSPDLREGSRAMVCGTVREKPKITYYHGISRVTAVMADSAGKISLCWFNEPWMVTQLPLNTPVSLYGSVRGKGGKCYLQNPQIVRQPGWLPVYHALQGIPARTFRKFLQEALQYVDEVCPETLPAAFRARTQLCDLSTALRQIHFPEGTEALQAAGRRLSFESMLMYLMRVAAQRDTRQPGISMTGCSQHTDAYWTSVGFVPTGAQRRVLSEIAADMEKDIAMSRLVQGDVGCGKTAIAFGAIYLCCGHGEQAAMMAPTEILARQHYENALRLLTPMGIRCRLLTGSTRAAERRKILAELSRGECDAVFGTHALISEGVNYHRLGLVITDEQHRFGVRQRSRLQEKGKAGSADGMDTTDGVLPHVLVMSATPIPRTLALILYGDLDLSVVDELPPGRKPVKTRLVPDTRREDMYRFLRQQLQQGHQAYVVCPLVEDSEELDQVRSAQSVYEDLTAHALKDLRVGLTWGGQKSDDKARVLQAFSAGELDVLVSTTVIEVGVNVPNATIMIIENAERYGLSQLHQLRGRVGRGVAESWCFLLSENSEKLRILCETQDGFQVAQRDLELRGPGDLMGTRQSGEPVQGVLLSGDTRLLEEVTGVVRELFADAALWEEKEQILRLSDRFFADQGLRIARN